jgi:HEAT repeat protein
MMKKLLVLVLAASVLFGAGTAFAQELLPPGPEEKEEAPPAPQEEKVSQEEIKKLIGELGSNEWSVREAATKRLIVIGLPAAEAVEKLVGSEDIELRVRAKKILEALHYVSKADREKIEKEIDLCLWNAAKPAGEAAKKLIEALSSDDWKARGEAAKKLVEKGLDVLKEVSKLLDSEDPDLKDRAQRIVREIKEKAKKKFEEQLKKSIETLKPIKTAPYYLTGTFMTKGEKPRERVITDLLAGILKLKGEAGDGDSIIVRGQPGRAGVVIARIQMVVRNGRKRVVINGEEVTGLGKNPPPERVLAVMAAEEKLEMDLRLMALKTLQARGDARAVKRLVKLLEKSKGGLQLEAAKTLRKLTGQEFGPTKDATSEETKKAVEEWKKWWEENKEEKKYRFTEQPVEDGGDTIIELGRARKQMEEMRKKMQEAMKKATGELEKKPEESREQQKQAKPEKKETEPKKEEKKENEKSKDF